MPAAAGGDSGNAGAGAAAIGSAAETGVRGERSAIRDQRSRKRARQKRGDAQMTWASFYLVCFLAGLFMSAFTLLGGMGHFGGGHAHVPHMPHAHIAHGA